MADRINVECIIGWLVGHWAAGRGGLGKTEMNQVNSVPDILCHCLPSLAILYHHIVQRLQIQFVAFVITVVTTLQAGRQGGKWSYHITWYRQPPTEGNIVVVRFEHFQNLSIL